MDSTLLQFPSGAQRFKCTVTLGKRENKKTSDVTTIHFTTPGLYGSSNEAKHHGAVYALHNAFPQLQIHHMLPPGYREYFLSLEQEAKQGAKKATKPNSSAPAKPLPSSGSSSSASSSSSSSSATSSSSSYSKPALAIVSPSATAPATSYEKYDPFAKPVSSASTAPPRKTAAELWRPKLPSVHLGFTSRQLIDQLLKEAGPDAVSSSSKVTKASSASAAEKKALSAHLTRLGFQTAHISEALHWCSNLEDALDWLCLYVPEDTLPPAFQPSSTTRLVLPAVFKFFFWLRIGAHWGIYFRASMATISLRPEPSSAWSPLDSMRTRLRRRTARSVHVSASRPARLMMSSPWCALPSGIAPSATAQITLAAVKAKAKTKTSSSRWSRLLSSRFWARSWSGRRRLIDTSWSDRLVTLHTAL